MKQLLITLSDKAGIKSRRTKNIVKHIGWSSSYKIGSIIANFMLVPLTIDYLDAENYGIWLTLSSFISWFSFFDIGLGNGLKNKFAEAKALGNYKDAQAFVSTAYFTIGSISLGIVIIFVGINQFINWTQLFNTNASLQGELSVLFPIIFTFFGIQLVVKLITSIYLANQNHSIQEKVQFLGQALSLLVIFILTKTDQSSLLIFGIVFSALPVFILAGLNLFAFNNEFKKFKPKFSLWKKEYLREITGLGFKFFVIQIAATVLFSTDNFIISKLFGPKDVVPYNVALKYFSLAIIGFNVIITPYWSSFTEAYANKDFEWIEKSVSNIQKIWLIIPIALLVMVFLADLFYQFWVGEQVTIPLKLSIAMALFAALHTFSMIYVNFINGTGMIKLQLLGSIILMLINIPLSIIFSINFNMGLAGPILATCVCITGSGFLVFIQYRKIINNNAKGIWLK
ncbi:Membrane protein involved in the export of O-antigen and teichoic acid [Algoriphagus ornithinivorans]|uniref:Membrane protein involved in the export of O-antigen and teichoic acid n=1 Tax=Algoriphagus ornithinivorans TaxID=226506 RepID=A0A1I5JNK4_9BACT|nr:oligosaccharide flippase family protein [Algoriphagus ornithinivorans]SFO74309.1 Membrane protein involved in the export of O-antigen and teichoic acid [Algoriphagus ornithinivorans]